MSAQRRAFLPPNGNECTSAEKRPGQEHLRSQVTRPHLRFEYYEALPMCFRRIFDQISRLNVSRAVCTRPVCTPLVVRRKTLVNNSTPHS